MINSVLAVLGRWTQNARARFRGGEGSTRFN